MLKSVHPSIADESAAGPQLDPKRPLMAQANAEIGTQDEAQKLMCVFQLKLTDLYPRFIASECVHGIAVSGRFALTCTFLIFLWNHGM